MQKSNYTIRAMTRREVDLAIDWAAKEGWNPGQHDADCFYAADAEGFLVGLLDDEPIAAISVVKYGQSFGFLGFYIVKPAYRGQGYGIPIWTAGLARLSGRTIGLDGVVAQQDNYKKSGFVLAYRNIRYQGTGGGDRRVCSDMVPLSTLPWDTICAYDKCFFPDDRTSFLKCWLAQPQSTALGFVQNNQLSGYGVLRVCRSGYKVGPLFANTAAIAEDLLVALKSHTPNGAPIFLDVPEVNVGAVDLARRHHMSVVFETARMYAGTAPCLPVDRLFGVTTFELG